MMDVDFFLNSIGMLASWHLVLVVVAGLLFGLIAGVIPGVNSALGIAVILPLTFKMDSFTALMMLTAVYAGGLTGGGILAILLNTPGTPAAVATTFDGYPLAQKGKVNEAMGIQVTSSIFGGIFSFAVVLLLIQPMSRFALMFGPSEMMMLVVLVFVVISTLNGEEFLRSLFAGALGLMFSTIGTSNITSAERGTFGLDVLADGVPSLICIVGLFAIPELIDLSQRKSAIKEMYSMQKGRSGLLNLWHGVRMTFDYPITLVRSAVIGTMVGLLPAAGSAMASLLSYASAKNGAKPDQKYGEGEPEGLVAAEVANNASEGGALACLLCLGIPGSGSTAVLMGGFFLHGLTPGPSLMQNSADLVYALLYGCLFQMFLLGFLALGVAFCAAKVIRLPNRILVPMLIGIIALSAFSYRNLFFDVVLLFACGILGWMLKRYKFSPVNFMIGALLGTPVEDELYRSMLLFGSDMTAIFFRPLTGTLTAITLVFCGLQAHKLIKRYREGAGC